MAECESCGMPMQDASMHGGNDVENPYCDYCTDKDGKLKSREDVREGWINAAMKMHGISREEATEKVDEAMERMPAWKE